MRGASALVPRMPAWDTRFDMSQGAVGRDELAAQLLVAEFEFVSQLIPFYRRFEITALAGTGLVISAAVAAGASLISGENPDREAAGVVLGIAAWGPTLMLLVEIMALTRLRRASRYIARTLHPLAQELTQRTDILCWELAPTDALFEARTEGRFWRSSLNTAVSSEPLILAMALSSVGVTVGSALVEPTVAGVSSGCAAVVTAFAFAVYGVLFTHRHEGRGAVAPSGVSEPAVGDNPPYPPTP
jgi:hypothetical protein